jgi:hypothetical protein
MAANPFGWAVGFWQKQKQKQEKAQPKAALMWWDHFKTMQQGHAVTWDEFKQAFKSHHIPKGLMDRKMRELLALK